MFIILRRIFKIGREGKSGWNWYRIFAEAKIVSDSIEWLRLVQDVCAG